MQQLFLSQPLLFVAVVFVFGLLVGSFLNVVIYRMPVMLKREWREMATGVLTEQGCSVDCSDAEKILEKFNLVKPRSRCQSCQAPITALQNIPVISYLLMGGKCRNCKTRISIRYPLVELLTAITFAVVAWHFGYSWQTLVGLILTAFLISGSMIDYDHKLLPDNLTLPLVWLGLLAAVFGLFVDISDAVIGAILGYMVLWSIYWLFKLMTKKEGMGYGDFKLLGALGAFVGWQSLPIVILLSTVTGSIIGITLMLFAGKNRQTKIPFGPFLAIAGWFTFVWREPLNDLLRGFLTG